MQWRNVFYTIIGLLGIAIGLMMAIPAWESGNDEAALMPVILLGVGFYCLATIKKEDE
jgi:hypothetical protein